MNWKKIFTFGRSQETEVNPEEAGISTEALSVVKQNSNSRLLPFYRTDMYTENPPELAGLKINTKEDEAEELVLKLRKELNQLGYHAFICDHERSQIAVIKGTDQMDILSVQQTNGDNYDISNEMVIKKLEEWHKKYPFTIIGADFDWVEANFIVFPGKKDLKSFAKEAYKFCPDIVEQGAGSLGELIEEMEETKKLYLWWD
ncbi:DUF4253 domain-containing protein [Mesobacillus subterraneus]|uniref:DUF4253 domain-containing protein n=1 Tax=Mesobacillus subterraneus TaxID=285983 RepID=A0A3R9F324_9BACI|nr:DUF4253 domain-containing protein [Mesobacillus subterraneus]RSD28841.1 DUF4253 domain-containing protein [Mesobacillus subterraneus]